MSSQSQAHTLTHPPNHSSKKLTYRSEKILAEKREDFQKSFEPVWKSFFLCFHNRLNNTSSTHSHPGKSVYHSFFVNYFPYKLKLKTLIFNRDKATTRKLKGFYVEELSQTGSEPNAISDNKFCSNFFAGAYTIVCV